MSGSRPLWLLAMLLAVLCLVEGCGESVGERVGTRGDARESQLLLGSETSPAWPNLPDGSGHSEPLEVQYQITFSSPHDAVVEVDNVSQTMPFSVWCDEGTTHTAHFPSPQTFEILERPIPSVLQFHNRNLFVSEKG